MWNTKNSTHDNKNTLALQETIITIYRNPYFPLCWQWWTQLVLKGFMNIRNFWKCWQWFLELTLTFKVPSPPDNDINNPWSISCTHDCSSYFVRYIKFNNHNTKTNTTMPRFQGHNIKKIKNLWPFFQF
jgi:hypothetical protein